MSGLRGILLSRSDDERRDFWAKTFGIRGPEWMIILVLSETENFTASEDTVVKALRVNQSFFDAHVQILERNGHIEHSSFDDGNIATLSLTSTSLAKLKAAL
jgi:MarR family transcriptional regulator, organic hydroperoxide resistance regulator